MLQYYFPLQCQYCKQPYCSSHFPATTHSCPDMPPAHVLNRIAPICPMCNIPQSTNPGEDPNIVMNRHIQRECQGARTKRDEIRELKARKDKGEICWKKNCTKVLVVKIKCDVSKSWNIPEHQTDYTILLAMYTSILSHASSP